MILGYMCRITVIFETLKDGTPLINICASYNCFCYRDIFHNGGDSLSKTEDTVLTESSILFGVCDNVEILLACDINTNYGITNGI